MCQQHQPWIYTMQYFFEHEGLVHRKTSVWALLWALLNGSLKIQHSVCAELLVRYSKYGTCLLLLSLHHWLIESFVIHYKLNSRASSWLLYDSNIFELGVLERGCHPHLPFSAKVFIRKLMDWVAPIATYYFPIPILLGWARVNFSKCIVWTLYLCWGTS